MRLYERKLSKHYSISHYDSTFMHITGSVLRLPQYVLHLLEGSTPQICMQRGEAAIFDTTHTTQNLSDFVVVLSFSFLLNF